MTPHRALRPLEQVTRRDERQHDVRWLTEAQAAEYCLYFERHCANPVRAFQKMARRQGIPVRWVGRSRHYNTRVLDAFMERDGWTKRHRPVQAAAMRLVR